VTAGFGSVLQVRDLRTHFRTHEGTVRAVDGVSLEVPAGRTLGVVGESGCGKSITALSIMRLVRPPGWIAEGSVLLGETDLLALSEAEMRAIRGDRISMIFQEPMTSLNPVLTTGWQVAEAIRLHRDVTSREAMSRTTEMFRAVGIPDPERRARQYPHEMSGGMRQRIMIAMALSTEPELLIADEPTTALDVTIQAQILDLLRTLQVERGMSLMLITHDLGVVAEMADTIVVMYAGQVVESGSVFAIFDTPHHPYTQGLLASLPRLSAEQSRLTVIEGTVPEPLDLPPGCRFAPRCPHAMPICERTPPPLSQVRPGQSSRCWLTREGGSPGSGADAPPDNAACEAAHATSSRVTSPPQ
jgi:oligopeptide/dipeptide ABC transporter ATP-binding protein